MNFSKPWAPHWKWARANSPVPEFCSYPPRQSPSRNVIRLAVRPDHCGLFTKQARPGSTPSVEESFHSSFPIRAIGAIRGPTLLRGHSSTAPPRTTRGCQPTNRTNGTNLQILRLPLAARSDPRNPSVTRVYQHHRYIHSNLPSFPMMTRRSALQIMATTASAIAVAPSQLLADPHVNGTYPYQLPSLPYAKEALGTSHRCKDDGDSSREASQDVCRQAQRGFGQSSRAAEEVAGGNARLGAVAGENSGCGPQSRRW